VKGTRVIATTRLGVALALVLGACNEPEPPTQVELPPTEHAPVARPAPAPAAAPAPSAPASAEAPLRFAGTDLDEDALLAAIAHTAPVSFKPVGKSATVFRTRFGGDIEAAFKSATRDRPHGAEAEVAAYRLARCLRIDSVPPAISRELPAAQIHAALDPTFAARWDEIRERIGVAEDGIVHGAMIHWIPVLADVGLDRRDNLARIRQWLGVGGTLGDSAPSLAASVATMIGFDYLIGNFDRFSGDNVAGDAKATFVYIRDHDLAFPRIGDKLRRRMLDDLAIAQRFPRAFYENLKRLDRACFERQLALDPRGVSGLLTKRQIDDVLERRETLLSHIDSLIAQHGENKVLSLQ
jgi:hypothetical protein